jgi:hypothetical protein
MEKLEDELVIAQFRQGHDAYTHIVLSSYE